MTSNTNIIYKVDSVYKTVLRGCNSYTSLLSLLQSENAPCNYDKFIDFMCNDFYVADDFMAIMALIDKNIDSYNEKSVKDVLLSIFESIFNDYKKLISK